jgi:hypothetical protein
MLNLLSQLLQGANKAALQFKTQEAFHFSEMLLCGFIVCVGHTINGKMV